MDMYPDDFQALLTDFQKKAVWRPTPENVEEYYYVQDIARRKALAFTNVAGYVMQKDPELSLSKDYPTVIPGQNALVRSREKEVKERIMRAKGDYGLLFFYSPTCEYCVEQEKIMGFFEEQYGWEIKRIDFTREKGLADMFGVTIVPTILLVYRDSTEAIPVSAGVISMSEMEDKIYRGVRLLAGEITPQEYSIYDFQKGGAFDVTAPAMKGKKEAHNETENSGIRGIVHDRHLRRDRQGGLHRRLARAEDGDEPRILRGRKARVRDGRLASPPGGR